jgi:tRNA threonylcarbamoyladenosine biosynthesis protein TsaB
VKLLAIESSTDLFTAALYLDGRIVEREGEPGMTHSEIALPLVRSLLDGAGIGLAGLDGVAIGCLAALALGAGEGAVYACTDARMNEIYCAAYRVHGESVDTVIAPVVAAPGNVPLPPGHGWLGCGSGFAAYGEAICARLRSALGQVDAAARPRAAALLKLAAPRFARGEGIDAAQATPLYVRDKIALTTRERLATGGLK